MSVVMAAGTLYDVLAYKPVFEATRTQGPGPPGTIATFAIETIDNDVEVLLLHRTRLLE
jgi:hypothetical protein